jgi:hypothetical protein
MFAYNFVGVLGFTDIYSESVNKLVDELVKSTRSLGRGIHESGAYSAHCTHERDDDCTPIVAKNGVEEL